MNKKTALITGANKGIGFEIARQLLNKNFAVVITARNEIKGEAALKILKEISQDVSFIKMDVTDIDSIERAVETFRENFSSLDVLVNNAGILIDKTGIEKLDIEIFNKTLLTNSVGPLLVTQHFFELINNNGRIINLSSELGALNNMGSYAPAYSISKTALNAITKQFAATAAPRGISVNAVCPGWVKTDMGGTGARLPVEKGAETAVWLAAEADISITGKFLKNKIEIKW